MLCHNCIYVIILQKPSDIVWGKPFDAYITECENENSILNIPAFSWHKVMPVKYIVCDEYTPKLNLKNRIANV
jgi:hypothetical protein